MVEFSLSEEAAMGTHAIVLLTEWDAFKEINYGKVLETMERPAYIFDGRNLLDEKALIDSGFNYYRIGKAFKHPS